MLPIIGVNGHRPFSFGRNIQREYYRQVILDKNRTDGFIPIHDKVYTRGVPIDITIPTSKTPACPGNRRKPNGCPRLKSAILRIRSDCSFTFGRNIQGEQYRLIILSENRTSQFVPIHDKVDSGRVPTNTPFPPHKTPTCRRNGFNFYFLSVTENCSSWHSPYFTLPYHIGL